MDRQMLKTIIVGSLFGALLFAAPFFVLKIAGFFLVFGLIFRLFKGRHRGRYWRSSGWNYADKIRAMSDEEYDSFKSNYRNHCGPDSVNDSEQKQK